MFNVDYGIEDSKIIYMRDMKPLDIGIITSSSSSYCGKVVMRTVSSRVEHFEVMLLTNPHEGGCFIINNNAPTKNDLKVRLLPKGTQLTLTIE